MAALVGGISGAYKGLKWIEIRSLPKMDAQSLVQSPVPFEAQKEAYLGFRRDVVCRGVHPCLDLITVENWEGKPALILEKCDAANRILVTNPIPSVLPQAIVKNLELYRKYLLKETENYSALATAKASGRRNRGGLSLYRYLTDWNLDTCSSESIPAVVDRLYGLDALKTNGTDICPALERESSTAPLK